LCEEACPKDAIYLSETLAPANFTRKGFIYGKEDLLIPNRKIETEKFAEAKGV
jgi:NADH-quinone oxidoreductase subunit I